MKTIWKYITQIHLKDIWNISQQYIQRILYENDMKNVSHHYILRTVYKNNMKMYHNNIYWKNRVQKLYENILQYIERILYEHYMKLYHYNIFKGYYRKTIWNCITTIYLKATFSLHPDGIQIIDDPTDSEKLQAVEDCVIRKRGLVRTLHFVGWEENRDEFCWLRWK